MSPKQQQEEHTCPYAVALSEPDISSIISDDDNSSLLSFQSTDEIQSIHGKSITATAATATAVADAFVMAKSKCPAFQQSSQSSTATKSSSSSFVCPFRDAKDAESLLEIVAHEVPPSHFTSAGSEEFRTVLEYVHKVSASLHKLTTKKEGKAATATTTTTTRGAVRRKSQQEPKKQKEQEMSYVLAGGCPFKEEAPDGSGSGDGAESFAAAMENLSLSALMARKMAHKNGYHPEDDDDNDHHQNFENLKQNQKSISQADDSQKPQTKNAQTSSSLSSSGVKQRRLSLSWALKNGTEESHAAAESVTFVKNFIAGIIDRYLYADLVTSLYHIYNALEQQLRIHAPTHFPALHSPHELERTPSLKEDMDYWHGLHWSQTQQPSPATLDYVQRIQFIAETEPLLLLAHAYTRYLGDLSGGRILARVARRALGLSSHSKEDHDGLCFYHFDHIPNAKQFKDLYRMELDRLALSSNQIARLVAEANVAFALNVRIFQELDVKAGVDGALVLPLEHAFSYLEHWSDNGGDAGDVKGQAEEEAKCPFASMGMPNPHGTTKMSDTIVKIQKQSRNKTIELDPKQQQQQQQQKQQQQQQEKKGQCPWPFLLFHDPVRGFHDIRTWIVLAVVLCWIWYKLQQYLMLFEEESGEEEVIMITTTTKKKIGKRILNIITSASTPLWFDR